MKFARSAVSDWYWAGSPERRFIISLLVTLAVIGVPWLAGAAASQSLVALFVGWDVGSWVMDRVYVDRISRRDFTAG